MLGRRLVVAIFPLWIGFLLTKFSYSSTTDASFSDSKFTIYYYSEVDESQGKNDSDLIMKGWSLSKEEVQQLESQVEKDSDDWADRLALISYYTESKSKKSETTKEARAKHILWIIEHHPEYKTDSYGTTWLSLYKSEDGTSYERAKELWLKQVGKHANDLQVFSNAAHFFQWNDDELFEKFLKRC